MGIITAAIFYKYGKKKKKKAQKEAREREERELETCVNCGWPRLLHSLPDEDCPS